jgi:hypothetical protein
MEGREHRAFARLLASFQARLRNERFFLNSIESKLKSRNVANIDANLAVVEICFHQISIGSTATKSRSVQQEFPKVLTFQKKISQTDERRVEGTQTGAQMDKDAEGLGADFELWQQLTDDYEQALAALARGEPGARDLAMKLSLALRRLHPETPRLGSPD